MARWVYTGVEDTYPGGVDSGVEGTDGVGGSIQFRDGDLTVTGSRTLTFSTGSATHELRLTGSLSVSGAINATSYNVRSISTINSIGSTAFGDTSDDNHRFTGSILVSGTHGIEVKSPAIAAAGYQPIKLKADESAFAHNTIGFAGTGSVMWEMGHFGPHWDDTYKSALGLAFPHVNNSFAISNMETENGIKRPSAGAALGGKTHGVTFLTINYSGSTAIGKDLYASGVSNGRLYVNANDPADTIGQLIVGPTDAGKSSGDLNALFISGALSPVPGAARNSFLINAGCLQTSGAPLFFVSSSGEAEIQCVGKGLTGGHLGGPAFSVYHSGTVGGSGPGGSEKDIGISIRTGEAQPSGQGKCVYLKFQHGDAGDGGGIRCGSTVANPELFNGSDIRIKRDVRPTRIKGLETINALEMIEFKWDPLYQGNQKLVKIGFSAQNCEQSYPEMVAEDPHVHEKFGFKIKSIAKAELIPILVKAVQELSEEVAELKRKIDDS